MSKKRKPTIQIIS